LLAVWSEVGRRAVQRLAVYVKPHIAIDGHLYHPLEKQTELMTVMMMVMMITTVMMG
jgi:hypothetical protein